jgi:hypothetical protein
MACDPRARQPDCHYHLVYRNCTGADVEMMAWSRAGPRFSSLTSAGESLEPDVRSTPPNFNHAVLFVLVAVHAADPETAPRGRESGERNEAVVASLAVCIALRAVRVDENEPVGLASREPSHYFGHRFRPPAVQRGCWQLPCRIEGEQFDAVCEGGSVNESKHRRRRSCQQRLGFGSSSTGPHSWLKTSEDSRQEFVDGLEIGVASLQPQPHRIPNTTAPLLYTVACVAEPDCCSQFRVYDSLQTSTPSCPILSVHPPHSILKI